MAAKKTQSDSQSGKDRPGEDPIQAAIDYGIDIELLRDNLARSYAERIRRHQIALDTMQKLMKAREVE